MYTFDLHLRDLIWAISLIVSVAVSYGKIRSELRHLEDTKAERSELQKLGEEMRDWFTEIRTGLARVEEAVRFKAHTSQDSDD